MREDWVIVKLGEFAAHEKGKKPKNQKAKQDEVFKFPYVNIEAFEKGIIETYTDGEKCNFCYEDDFLMVWDGSRSGLVGKGMNGALGSTLVRINFPGIENDYAYHFLSSKYQEINTRAKGSGTPHVDPYLLWNYDFPICSLSEQRAIVSKIETLFSDLDKGIEDLNKAKDQLKIYRQAVLKKAFEGELTKEWREKQKNLTTAEELLREIKEKRQKYFDQQLEDWNKSVKDWEKNGTKEKKPVKPRFVTFNNEKINEIYKIPGTWYWSKLGNIANKISDGPFGSHLKTSDYVESGVRVIRLENIGNLSFDDSKKSYISNEKYKTIINHTVLPNDLIFSSFISDFISVVSIPKKIEFAINKADCFCVRFDDFVDYKFFEFFLSTRITYRQLVNEVHGATRPRINTTQLKEILVPVCSKYEQHQIVQEIESRLSVCDKVEQSIGESLEKAKALRQSILKKAFEGTLLTKAEIEKCKAEADYEPAGVLLERIRKEKKK